MEITIDLTDKEWENLKAYTEEHSFINEQIAAHEILHETLIHYINW